MRFKLFKEFLKYPFHEAEKMKRERCKQNSKAKHVGNHAL